MASTGAVLYIRPRVSLTVAPGRHTGAVLDVALRLLTGLYSTSGVVATSNLRNAKAWLPPPRVPIGYVVVNGQRLPVQIDERSWWNFFHYVVNTVLGGPDAATLADVTTTVSSVQEQASTVATVASGLTQMATQNAEALATAIEVVQNNSLAGASQIPEVQHTSQLER